MSTFLYSLLHHAERNSVFKTKSAGATLESGSQFLDYFAYFPIHGNTEVREYIYFSSYFGGRLLILETLQYIKDIHICQPPKPQPCDKDTDEG